jgi:rod shape-determining protein MreD
MKRFFFYLASIWLFLWLQTLNSRWTGPSGISPDLAFLGVLYFGFFRGPLAGEWMGFAMGLFLDAAAMGLLGLHAALYAVAGYAAGVLRRPLDEEQVWTQGLFAFLVSAVYLFFYGIFDHYFSGSEHMFSARFAFQALMNGFLAPFYFWLIDQWFRLWDFEQRRSNVI